MNAPLHTLQFAADFLCEGDGYRILPHPHHRRLYQIELDIAVLQRFMEITAGISAQNLEYIPYQRFLLARELAQLLDEQFQPRLRAILKDRRSGGFTLGFRGQTVDQQDYIRLGTAIGHLIGPTNFDAMSGTFYARFVVKDNDGSDSYLRQAYRLFTLHTDGTFVDEPTDWLQMMKLEERHATGGESRLLHLDDWAELDHYVSHPLASFPFTYKAPPSKNVAQTIERRTFFQVNDRPCICFIDQFVCPESVEHAAWLAALSDSMENDPATTAIPLPVGDLIMLNNQFWLHGRAPFEKHPELHRELMRQRGVFASL